MIKKCANPACTNLFTPKSKAQKYCCRKCQKYGYKHTEKVYSTSGIPLREFRCRECGKQVIVYDKDDRRREFCSRQHEQRWWKHRDSQKHTTVNNGMSGGMSLESLKRREARDLW